MPSAFIPAVNTIEVAGLSIRRGSRRVLKADRLVIVRSDLTVILGHNGSGKSTLMNILARQASPDEGTVSLDGKPLHELSQRDLARAIAYLPQRLPNVAGLTVRELVYLGRFAWRGTLGHWRSEDRRAVNEAMALTHVEPHAETLVDHLSGGERQRAWIAMLLAQQSPFLLLDEPTSALDLGHQYDLMALLSTLNRHAGKGIVVVLHDVNLATRYADRIIALRHGEVAFDGSSDALLSSDLLSGLYDVDIHLVDHPLIAKKIAIVNR
ncbi:MAG TPA: ABC transporter ATP-binding protein [Azospirillaceae bacterium]|nr:ABC transporter ATP-binding protein [Azospirillaceae bacterium]